MSASERRRTRKREYQQEWRKKNPDYHKRWWRQNTHRARQYNLLKRYGLTEEDYQRMAEEQENCCKICQRPAQLEYHGKLHVDHLKGTKVVRGLLCGACNQGIGLFKENPRVLAAAIEYLRVTAL